METTLLEVPADYTQIESVMSNFDHVIERDVEAQLKSGPYWAGYLGWDFYGKVWWLAEEQRWACMVLCYRAHVDTITAPTLDELMTEVGDRFGYR